MFEAVSGSTNGTIAPGPTQTWADLDDCPRGPRTRPPAAFEPVAHHVGRGGEDPQRVPAVEVGPGELESAQQRDPPSEQRAFS